MVKSIFQVIGLMVSFAFVGVYTTEAKVKLPVLVSDGMVLQQQQSIKVWGWADPQEEVTVTFLKKKYKTTTSAGGNWEIILPPQKAGGPHLMTINDIQLKDILVGDVWLCSGQSNMELPIARVMDMFADEVNKYTNPQIRQIRIPLDYNFHEPQEDVKQTAWKALEPGNVMNFSALAYFFAKEWYTKHKVPVGLINSAVGGSPVEAWISEEGLKPFPKYLNEREFYKSDEYIADIRQRENKGNQLWHEVLYRTDAGLNEPVKWYAPQYNDAHWKEADLFDTSWNNNGLNPVNGSFWFRKHFNIPANLAGKESTLRLGCIVDADSVFVNGTFVGTTGYQYPPRIYKIPAGLLHEGNNQITIRLISYGGYPHFVKEKPYKLVFKESELSLEGNWKHKIGTEMPPSAGQTFFQYKPVGLYNSMIAPLKNYVVKGAIWYQGESNTNRYNEYTALLSAMINDWRSIFNLPELPFVVVELALFGQPDGWDNFRAAQQKVTEQVPHTGFAPAKDLGEWNDIHPLNKKDVGIRVANEMEKLINK
ncbi:sialate O-acetylesterase [Bacteroides sp. 519]|uniref:sialate O-acetylesterase n=1 Tax=Bacteroides sp. 519 TaxID=2302937 RepID=UPI0013CFB0A5|nr:sialate O-acetylesterase [Bacteroides sp. 519]NDV60602.1 sialate O-acetylesterase [Bacteroides sp. 519]